MNYEINPDIIHGDAMSRFVVPMLGHLVSMFSRELSLNFRNPARTNVERLRTIATRVGDALSVCQDISCFQSSLVTRMVWLCCSENFVCSQTSAQPSSALT